MYKDILTKTGLTQVQAEIVNFLLEKGENRASAIGKAIKRPRGVAYKGLDELLSLELVEKQEKSGQVATFRIAHPEKLNKLIEKKELDLSQDKKALEQALPQMVSLYNLTQNKPGVRFFEGREGIIEVLNDTLTSKTEILTIADIEAANKYIPEINENYVQKRTRKNIPKRLLVADTDYARRRYEKAKNLTDLRLIKIDTSQFSTSIHIYSNKIAYITMSENQLSAVIVSDPHIFTMHKTLFEYMWQTAQTIGLSSNT